jgi:arylsulfatase A-like enzyme
MSLICGCQLLSSNQGDKKPNVIFIVVDDLGWTDLGCYGSTFHETQNLDKLASHGVRFTNAYAASPVCSPTRAALLTGKYPSRVNITDWIPGLDPKDKPLLGPQDVSELDLKEKTLAESMQQHGYKTFFAGKWHLGSEGYFPEHQGFEINKGGHHMGQPPSGYYAPYKNPKLEDGPDGEYLTDRLTDESIAFMEENKDNPFFLYLAFYTVHTPIEACVKHADYYQNKLASATPNEPIQKQEHDALTVQNQVNPAYASMVHSMDENVGRLLNRMEDLGLKENTIIVFTSDNGGLTTLRDHPAPTSVLPLRGGKGWCYEGGIRVPLIIQYPGLRNDSISNIPVISMDLFPTILDLAGLPLLPDQHQDGISLKQHLLEGKPPTRDVLYWHFPHYHGSLWKPGAAIRKGDWKLIKFYHYDKVELYNLKNDIAEQFDISNDYPEKVTELELLLTSMQKETNATLPVLNPDFTKD